MENKYVSAQSASRPHAVLDPRLQRGSSRVCGRAGMLRRAAQLHVEMVGLGHQGNGDVGELVRLLNHAHAPSRRADLSRRFTAVNEDSMTPRRADVECLRGIEPRRRP